MKINILSPGRFHVLDLARELDKQGHDVEFYSFVPTKRAQKYGLPKKCSKSIFLVMLPFLALRKIFPKVWLFEKWRKIFQDWFTSKYMRKCDILIAMSGNVCSLERAKKDGAIVILERGSKHILEQKKILDSIPSLKGRINVPAMNVQRELKGYQLADYIAIASQHVKDSLIKHGINDKKLFVNPYGVDLEMFKPIPDVKKEYDVIMVGGWSYRKGCDLIIEAIKKLQVKFLHVGSIVDVDFPKDKLFTHIDSVDQKKLIHYYNKAKIFILPSREEGLAMVQMQAVSCNLPLICSKDSGGEDLTKYFGQSKAISVLKETTSNELAKEIDAMLKYVASQPLETVYYDMNGKSQLTWEAYGKRYSDFLKQI
ncbi:glycosyltransferase family 4 protein [Epilithonimonas vandammei]|uniref:glycosyltransferase family 4 protein n=1 Tax=Epilithonimonas vandammei TaxID=2487072 RepID=UPI0028A6840E|nr:glycosyltransferase family 4 protein [Epilithonimonas vandammei]